jgi:hypothetical protein
MAAIVPVSRRVAELCRFWPTCQGGFCSRQSPGLAAWKVQARQTAKRSATTKSIRPGARIHAPQVGLDAGVVTDGCGDRRPTPFATVRPPGTSVRGPSATAGGRWLGRRRARRIEG